MTEQEEADLLLSIMETIAMSRLLEQEITANNLLNYYKLSPTDDLRCRMAGMPFAPGSGYYKAAKSLLGRFEVKERFEEMDRLSKAARAQKNPMEVASVSSVPMEPVPPAEVLVRAPEGPLEGVTREPKGDDDEDELADEEGATSEVSELSQGDAEGEARQERPHPRNRGKGASLVHRVRR